jgi:hypothetical protein
MIDAVFKADARDRLARLDHTIRELEKNPHPPAYHLSLLSKLRSERDWLRRDVLRERD